MKLEDFLTQLQTDKGGADGADGGDGRCAAGYIDAVRRLIGLNGFC